MPFEDILCSDIFCSWLMRSALVSLAILVIGSGAVLIWRQPLRRVRIIELVLGGCLIAPWLGLIPGYPQLPLVASHTPVSQKPEVPLPAPVEPTSEPMTIEPMMAVQLPEHAAQPFAETTTIKTPVHAFDIRPWIVGIYFVGVAIGALWWLVGIVALSRLLRTSRPAPSHCRELLTEISAGRSDRVRLLVSRRLSQPFASAWGRAVIVLPENLCGDERALRWCLAHEWAHVDGHDFRAWLLAGLVRVLFFYQPLLWWLRRQLRICQDFIADSQAARQGPQVEDYAEFLTARAVAGRSYLTAARLSMASRKSELYRRVIMLLKDQPLERRTPRLWMVSVTVAALVLVAVVAAVSLVPRAVAEEKPAVIQAPAKPADDQSSTNETQSKNAPKQGLTAEPKTTAASAPADDTLAKRFLEEAPAKWREIDSKLNGFEVKGEYVTKTLSPELKKRGGRSRPEHETDRVVFSSDGIQAVDEQERRVFGMNKAYTFELTKSTQGALSIVNVSPYPPRIDVLRPRPPRPNIAFITAIGRVHGIRSFFMLDFFEIVSSPDFKVKKATETTQNDKHLMSITFEYQLRNPDPKKRLLPKSYKGTILFAPDSYWAIIEGKMDVDGGDKLLGGYQIKQRLATTVKRIPVVVESSFRDYDKQGNTLETLLSKFDWKEFKESDGNKTFTLSAYGFPEPRLEGANPAPATPKANDQSDKNSAAKPADEVSPASDQPATKEAGKAEPKPAPSPRPKAEPTSDEAKSIAAIQKLGGKVTFDEKGPGKPGFGVEFGGTKMSKEAWALLKGLTRLQSLNLTQISDAELGNIEGFTTLQTLFLYGQHVTTPVWPT